MRLPRPRRGNTRLPRRPAPWIDIPAPWMDIPEPRLNGIAKPIGLRKLAAAIDASRRKGLRWPIHPLAGLR